MLKEKNHSHKKSGKKGLISDKYYLRFSEEMANILCD